MIKNIFRKFQSEEYTRCWIIAKESDIIDICRGKITTNIDEGIEIEYEWKDKTNHTFIAGQSDNIGLYKKEPLFQHNVGSLFVANEKSLIGSEYLNMIVKSDIGTQMLRGLEELREESSLPWKKIIILAGVAVLIFYLWKTGWLSNVLSDIFPNAG